MKKLAKAMYGKSMMKKGGIRKAKVGTIVGNGGDDKNKKNPPEENTPITKPEVSTVKKTYKVPIVARAASYFTGKTEYQKNENPVTGMDVTRTYKDGKKERVIKTKASEETGQRPMQKKGGPVKMKMGGTAKPKAMYGMSTRPSMMRKGGAKKK